MNYNNTERRISDMIEIGGKRFRVSLEWFWIDDNERMNVVVEAEGMRHRFEDVGGSALQQFASVFLTISAMLQQEPIEA